MFERSCEQLGVALGQALYVCRRYHNWATGFSVLGIITNFLIPPDVKIKVKVKLTLEQTTKAQKWSRDVALHFL
jgi:hypothetical protein